MFSVFQFHSRLSIYGSTSISHTNSMKNKLGFSVPISQFPSHLLHLILGCLPSVFGGKTQFYTKTTRNLYPSQEVSVSNWAGTWEQNSLKCFPSGGWSCWRVLFLCFPFWSFFIFWFFFIRLGLEFSTLQLSFLSFPVLVEESPMVCSDYAAVDLFFKS